MRPLEDALKQLKEIPEEKICEIFAKEIDNTDEVLINPNEVSSFSNDNINREKTAAFFYEGRVTIDGVAECRSIVLNDTASDSSNPDDALTLEDILPHVIYLAKPVPSDQIRLRIIVEELDAE